MTTISSGVESRKSGSRPKHRSRSSPRANDRVEKKKHISAANSLVSVPNTIKLSMLNSGLLSSSKCKHIVYLFSIIHTLDIPYDQILLLFFFNFKLVG